MNLNSCISLLLKFTSPALIWKKFQAFINEINKKFTCNLHRFHYLTLETYGVREWALNDWQAWVLIRICFFFLFSFAFCVGPLHIPAKRPGFDADPSVIRHPHPWSSYESAAGYDTQYHSQYILDRERKPLYYGYPDPQFTQVRK